MGNIHAYSRPSYGLMGRKRDRSACERKLDALQVHCRRRVPSLSLHSPDFLRAPGVDKVVKECCDWVGTRDPSSKPVPHLWYQYTPQGIVNVLGPADMGPNGRPKKIYNVLELTDYVLGGRRAYPCSGLGNLRPGAHHATPALAIILEEDAHRKVYVVCRLGRLDSDGSSFELHFHPCGSKEGYLVMPEQVAELHQPLPPGMEACVQHGTTPGHAGPEHLQQAHKATAPGRVSQARSLALEATQSCARSSRALSDAVRVASEALRSGTGSQQREALKKVREELSHAQAHRLIPQQCQDSVTRFAREADPVVCLAEANEALTQEGHEPIPVGATAMEDVAHMTQREAKLREEHSTSRAVGILSSCLKQPKPRGHARTDLDDACGSIPAVATALQKVHDSPPGDRPNRVEALRALLQALPTTTSGLRECDNAAAAYVDAAQRDRCRGLIGARPGESLSAAIGALLLDARSGRREVDCNVYQCVRDMDRGIYAGMAEEALEASSALKHGGKLMGAVQSACKKHQSSLEAAARHMTGKEEWNRLLQEASDSGDFKCHDAVADYIVGVANSLKNDQEACRGKKVAAAAVANAAETPPSPIPHPRRGGVAFVAGVEDGPVFLPPREPAAEPPRTRLRP